MKRSRIVNFLAVTGLITVSGFSVAEGQDQLPLDFSQPKAQSNQIFTQASHLTDLIPAEQCSTFSQVSTCAEEPSCSAPEATCGMPAEKCCCSAKKQKELAAKAAGAYKGLFYANDFSYLNDPCYKGDLLGERLKQMKPFGCRDITIDVGGEYRGRFHHEENMKPSNLVPGTDDFWLDRTRLYTNIKFGSNFRFYGEYLDALSSGENLPVRPIDENRSDILNLFGDLRLLDGCKGELWARVGRQELLFGQQRAVSPLDWSNTRRTFEGVKLMYKGQDWDIDGFLTRPVWPASDYKNADHPDQSKTFAGITGSYKGFSDAKVDTYWLFADETFLNAPGGGDFYFNTFGANVYGGNGQWLYDFEAAYQFGERAGDTSHSEGFFTIGLGRKAGKCVPWNPQFWAYFDWASANYNDLFPLGHKYMGFMDFFARHNLQDLNFRVTAQPHKRVKLLAWYHIFWLQDNDVLPANVINRPFPPGGTPGGDSNLGQEIDLTATITLTPRSNVVLGYSHFFTGDWYATNPTPPPTTDDADFFYSQFTLRF